MTYCIWNISPTLVSIGPFEIRWYGVLFALSFYMGLSIMQWIYKREKITPHSIDTCLTYIMLGVVIGARLAHCFFYEPEFFLAHPIEILKVWKGGLASHGGGAGLLIALWLYTRRSKTETMIWMMDRLSLTVLLGGFFIRLGNFMNSEIMGLPSSKPWAIIFARYDLIPRHPVQLYESFSYLLLCCILFILYIKTPISKCRGMMVGFCISGIFLARIILESFKEQVASYKAIGGLHVGQWLSIPFLLVGLFFIWYGFKDCKKIR